MINSLEIRDFFPSIGRTDSHNNKIIYLDGPGGTQVPIQVIEAISEYYIRSNANTHGEFITSKETDQVMDELRLKMSEFLGSEGPNTISIGQNMTSLNYSLARALAKKFKEGDEVVITELDHEANRGPWNVLKESGIKLIEVKLLQNGGLDYEDFRNKINEKTVMVCMGMSSNALGTLNDFKTVKSFLPSHCIFLLDAVHYAPHFSINVNELGCDFLLCSAYKFYGPHVGFLYSKPGTLEGLETDRLVVQNQSAPYIIETGTLNHAACAGVSSAIDFIANIGRGDSLRDRLINAYSQISSHEFNLAKHLYDSLVVMGLLDELHLYSPLDVLELPCRLALTTQTETRAALLDSQPGEDTPLRSSEAARDALEMGSLATTSPEAAMSAVSVAVGLQDETE